MSYLLDALRKSEAQRRLGELPTLSTATPYAGSARRGSRKGLLSVIVLMAVGLGAFVVWREVLVPWPEAQRTADIPQASEPLWEGPLAPTEQAPTPVGARGPSHRENPEEVRRRPAEPESPVAEAQAPEDPAPEPVGARGPSHKSDREEIGQRPAEPEAPQPADDFTPARREFIRQWELPASVRSELPELNVMAHIYSDNPENRFVLMNGRRYVEGDSLGEGAILAEIRREGAVVDFREYRFLVE